MRADTKISIYIEDEKWNIRLTEAGELMFSYMMPYEKSIEATNPLWYDFDRTPYIPSEYTSVDGVTNISPFILKERLINGVVDVVSMSKCNFFYFKPNTKQKGNIYSNIVNLLISKLKGVWVCQVIDKTWFYFTKIED